MFDVRQFRSVLYLLLGLGLTGFSVAARAPGLWVLSMSALVAHASLRRRGAMGPLPSWAAAILACFFLLVTFRTFTHDPGNQLLAAGEFLAALQLVKLYQEGSAGLGKGGQGTEGRAENRNYAWLLVLSFLLMVAAMISTASLLFGVMLLGYLFLSLYACQLFHLKVEAEAAKLAMTLPRDIPHPTILRQDERKLGSSMRRLTALIAAAGLTCAVVVFVSFPRGPGAGMLGQLNFKPSQVLTGFSEEVRFDSVSRIQQSQQRVAYMTVTRSGRAVTGAETIYWRGLTLDTYSGDGQSVSVLNGRRHSGAKWLWTRSTQAAPTPRAAQADELQALATEEPESLVQHVTLEPTGVGALFAAPGACAVTFSRDTRFKFSPVDETLALLEPAQLPLSYTVVSRGTPGYSPASESDRIPAHDKGFASNIDPKVREFAQRPEVSGRAPDGTALWTKRRGRAGPSPVDAEIADNMVRYLRANYFYTLDLTGAPGAERDPMVRFLLENKRGHCEHFAGAMTLMCQALGIEARMVTGFKLTGDAYNTMAQHWIVRQSDAHAWVEVLVGQDEQWQTFDPTTGREAVNANKSGFLARLRRFSDYLEYTWADAVVAYDRERRDNLLQNVEKGLTTAAAQGTRGVSGWGDWLPDPSNWGVSPRLVSGTIMVIVLMGVGAIARFAWERWMLRRRAARIGLDALPGSDQIRLARQLGFYDELLRMLEQRGYSRDSHLTPMEFASSLTHLPSGAYESVRRLTRIYYRIRYGRAELVAAYQQRIGRTLSQLELALGPKATP